MEPSSIVVLVMTLGTLALLVYAEINSRRNSKAADQQKPSPTDPK